MIKPILKKLQEQVVEFLQAEDGFENWIIAITIMSIITMLYTADTQFQRVKSQKYQIRQQTQLSLESACNRIDFYKASEHDISIESDYDNEFEEYLMDNLLLDNNLRPYKETDFGIEGQVIINNIEVISSGYNATLDMDIDDTGLMAELTVPIVAHILGMDFPMNIPINVFAQIKQ